jgi:hypothetical protein
MKHIRLAENSILGLVFEWLKQNGDHSKTGHKYVRFSNVRCSVVHCIAMKNYLAEKNGICFK